MKKLDTVILMVMFFATAAYAAEFSVDLKVVNQSRFCPANSPGGALEVELKKGKPEVDKLKLVATPKNQTGDVNYSFFHTVDGLQIPPSWYGKPVIELDSKTRSSEVTFRPPPLRNDRFFAQVLLVVTATDSRGAIAKASKTILVSRESILEKSQESSANCMQVYEPIIRSGVYDNQNDTDMIITTTDGVSRVTEERRSKTTGWSVVPTLFSGSLGFSLFGFNSNRLNALAQQVNESSHTAVTITLNPGDVGFRYSQKSRLKEAFDIYNADGCGNMKKVEQGVIYLDREVISDSFYKVPAPYNPKAFEVTIKNKLFGRQVVNTCSAIDTVSVPFYSEK